MASLGLMDLAARTGMAKKKGWIPKAKFKPGGEKGKLHREMGIPEGETIPADRLRAATHSSDAEKRRDAIRAETMKSWKKPKGKVKSRREAMYDHKD